MEIPDKHDMIMALGRSAEELHQHIEIHRKLLASMLGKQVDEKDLEAPFGLCPLRTREARLREAIQEAIEVLDESRKAFKSKRLELLRKKLTMILVDSR